ncbi:DEAD/DEAH box helicase family protein [Clostridium cibarium]|uniref:DEAD/DEAH box helicase family protein n=1 Tax=Clostridium cibarium TaxID=2762247 RepID=A0ABR8PXS1_9CLOT|nr:DEAD/DEAH box helicase family protein [Clostridium cibarium]MBD7912944.1 DEAD/DEAH box helicase family protein [Clostridium cibarium]
MKVIDKIKMYMSLREPQYDALSYLESISAELDYKSCSKEQAEETATINCENKETIKIDKEFNFPSFCFSMATGLGKTRLMGASIYYLYKTKGYKHFFILAPGNTIYEKLKKEFHAFHPKYIFKGLDDFGEPRVYDGENYLKYSQIALDEKSKNNVEIFIFNIGKIFNRGDVEFKFHKYNELLGASFANILRSFDDLVICMDESHRYYAPASKKAIDDLKPILGLEFTATPKLSNKNIIFTYDLAKAAGRYLKIPVVVGRTNTGGYSDKDIEEMKLKDGIKLHEERKKNIYEYCSVNQLTLVKPIVLVSCKDTNHASEVKKLIDSDEFFEGKYRGKVIEIHSGTGSEETEENIQKLLTIEENTNPIEIVLHVYKLKEGWDVNNLFTIIPLNAAKSDVLAIQTIGRGLRLPFGKITGNEQLDTLEIVAHEHYREIIDDVRENPIFKTRNLDDKDIEDIQQVSIESIFDNKESEIQYAIKMNNIKKSNELLKEDNINNLYASYLKGFVPKKSKEVNTGFQNVSLFDFIDKTERIEDEQVESQVVLHEQLNKSIQKDMSNEEIQNKILSKEEFKNKIAQFAEKNIDIPKISISFNTSVSFKDFNIKCNIKNFENEKSIIERYDLLNNKLLEEVEAISLAVEDGENTLACMLLDAIPEFSYEDAEYIMNIVNQYIKHINRDEESINQIVRRYGYLIVEDIKKQIYENIIDETEVLYNVEQDFIVFSGFTKHIKKTDGEINFRKEIKNKNEIRKYIYTGFKKSYYDKVAFDSDAERKFAVILEEDKEVLKWVKPPLNQIGIFYKSGKQYNPDFIVETDDRKYLVEIKNRIEVDSKNVKEKAVAAIQWCEYASKVDGGKEWEYCLIADDKIKLDNTFAFTKGLAENMGDENNG